MQSTIRSALAKSRRNRVFEEALAELERKRKILISKTRKLTSRSSTASVYSNVSQECWIDKDRSAAYCGEGGEDLKGEFQANKEVNRRTKVGSRATGIQLCVEVEQRIQQQVSVLIEQTEHELKRKNPESALLYANRGLALRPSDIPCLALQCQCYVELNKFQKALEAANGILCQEGAGNNWIALYSKGESLYNLCDFEKSLVFFHRARRQCPTKEKDKMNIRISRAEMAVTNVLGGYDATQHFKLLTIMCSTQSINPEQLCIRDNLELYQLRQRHKKAVLQRRRRLAQKWQPRSRRIAPAFKSASKNNRLSNLATVPEIPPVTKQKFQPYKVMKESEGKSDQKYLKSLVKVMKHMEESGVESSLATISEAKQQANEGLQFITDRKIFWSQQEMPEICSVPKKSKLSTDSLIEFKKKLSLKRDTDYEDVSSCKRF